MKQKDNPRREEASRVFRQFAWNLAGTLAKPARPGQGPKGSAGTQR
jgi:hypothetical protein